MNFFKYIIVFCSFVLLFSCNNQEKNNEDIDSVDTAKSKIVLIDEYSKFISGIKTKSLKEIQDKNFYKNYSKSVETTWNYFYLNQLLVITNWASNLEIISKNDTSCVFYPFSGPDFPFVYAFYPYAKKYLLIGLENIGVVPDFSNYSDLEIERYTNSLSSSLTDFFHKGYFSTEKMKYSFRNENMNGVVHPLLFFIARTGNKIENLQYFIIDDYGRMKIVENIKRTEKAIKGIKFSFTGKNGYKDLYYLQVDLSDQNFIDHPELVTFISNFEEKNVFIKSASYLLQDEKFNYFKDFLEKQAIKIIQDDSGFGYEFLKKNKFKINLYGNYSQTLNVFEKYWQPSLKEAYSNLKGRKLPFRFGYNIPFDETALIYAYKKKPPKIKYPIYKIQIKMSWSKISEDSFASDLKPVDYYYDEGYYKYTTGNYSSFIEAKNKLEKVKKEGFDDAFIIEISKSERKIIK